MSEELDLQGWFDYRDLYALVALNDSFTKYAEVGVWKGLSICQLCFFLMNTKKEFELYAIDHWEGSSSEDDTTNIEAKEKDIYSIYDNNMKIMGTREYIKDIKGDSSASASCFQDEYLDFVFIDADHEYENVKNDIESWYPKVRSGGIIGGHDLGTFSGVSRAVFPFFTKKKLTIHQAGINGTSWYVHK